MLRSNISRLKKYIPEVTLSCDIIVGFPGESEAEAAETLEFIRETEFLHLHVFPYSVRKGTEAAAMPCQIPQDVKTNRLRTMAEEQKSIKHALLDKYAADHAESPVYVLVEEVISDGVVFGHSEHFVEVEFAGGEELVGLVAEVKILSHNGDVCQGELVRVF